MKHIASCSFGKDSLAMCIKLIEEEWPLDEIVFYDTGMEFQAIYNERDRWVPWFEEHGIKFTQLTPPRPFVYDMLQKEVNKRNGMAQYGYGWCGGPSRWGTSTKISTCDHYMKDAEQYVGIAADEDERAKGKRYPLIEWGMTEKDCLEFCYEHGATWDEDGVRLYDVLDRVSCWCCANKNQKELMAIREHLPQYWKKLLALEKHNGCMRANESLLAMAERLR